MEDLEIIGLYFRRNEKAITETAAKYGTFCRNIALNILSNREDAEECVNDTYLQAWNTIPPQKPDKLGAWLGRVIRNIAYNLWKKNHRQRRYTGMEEILNELEDCIPSPVTVERKMEEQELTKVINAWIASLAKKDRILFVRRYWNGESVDALAKRAGVSAAAIAKRMYRLRLKLKATLEKEGYPL